jgi:hypothetical protein
MPRSICHFGAGGRLPLGLRGGSGIRSSGKAVVAVPAEFNWVQPKTGPRGKIDRLTMVSPKAEPVSGPLLKGVRGYNDT